MEKMAWNYRKAPRKSVVGMRCLSLSLLIATVALLSFWGSISVVVCLLWLGGLFSFFILLAGMNEDISPDVAVRKEVVIPAYIERNRIRKPRFFSPTYNE